MTAAAEMLGVAFDLRSGPAEDVAYAHAFFNAYHDGPRRRAHTSVAVRSARVAAAAARTGPRVPIHRTKHAYWTLDGTLESHSPRTVSWDRRGIRCNVTAGGSCLNVEVDDEVAPVFAGEAIFHAMRGIALARRADGPLLHASGIVIRGRTIAFSGAAGAGKSTLMAECVLNHGAEPLCNDRMLLELGAKHCIAHSWPSYASYCEGTLLRYPALEHAARTYEAGERPYVTQRWPASLRAAFTKDAKRIYPMQWFAEASGRQYHRSAPLAALLVVRVDPACDRMCLDEYHPGDEGCLRALASNLFPPDDPSFRPWHGLAPAATVHDAASVVAGLARSGVRLLNLRIPAEDLSSLPRVLEAALS